MKLKIIINLLIAFSLGNLTAFSSEELMSPSKRRKLSPLTLTELQEKIQLYRHQDFTEQVKNIDDLRAQILHYFQDKEDKGLFLMSPSELSLISELQLEQWDPYLKSYNPTFTDLCIRKALLDKEWPFPEIVKKNMEKEAAAYNPAALYHKSVMLQFGIVYKQKLEESKYLLSAAIKRMHPPALYAQYTKLLVRNDKRSIYIREPSKAPHPAVQLNLADAQNIHGVNLANGSEVEQEDPKGAYKYIKMAARQDQPDAICLIALMYEQGDGVNQNCNKAVYWTLKTASKEFQKENPDLPITTSLFVRNARPTLRNAEIEQRFYQALENFKATYNLFHDFYVQQVDQSTPLTKLLKEFDDYIYKFLNWLQFSYIFIDSWDLKPIAWQQDQQEVIHYQQYSINNRKYVSFGQTAVRASDNLHLIILGKHITWNGNLKMYRENNLTPQQKQHFQWLKRIPALLSLLVEYSTFRRNEIFEQAYPGLVDDDEKESSSEAQ